MRPVKGPEGLKVLGEEGLVWDKVIAYLRIIGAVSLKLGALTAAWPYGKARATRFRHRRQVAVTARTVNIMVKPEWGTKRTCPKCGERFYDLGNEDPATCIECGNEWIPEPVLKSKQPIPFEEVKKVEDKEADSDLADDDLEDIDDDDDSPDNDVDLGGDDDLGVDTADTEKEDDS